MSEFSFNPSRLITARKRRKLTAKKLAGEAGISSVHLSRIENGKAENVESSTVESLATALNFPVEFFFGDDLDEPNLDGVSFRSLSAMSARERDSALASGSIGFLISEWADTNYSLPDTDLADLSFEQEPNVAAAMLREYWGLGIAPISNMVHLLEYKGVRVFSLAETTKNVDAFSCWRDGSPYVFLNTFKTGDRSRFDAAHELGHLVLHRHGNANGREAEREADIFASHFLIPKTDLMANLRLITSLNQLVRAKRRWGISLAALVFRAHKEKLITDWQYRSFCIQISKMYKKSEPNGIEHERSAIWEKIYRYLWRERRGRSHLSSILCLPDNEVQALTFGCMPNAKPLDIEQKLTIIKLN